MRTSRSAGVTVSTPKYSASWKTPRGKLVGFSRRNLGDKLQRLYHISPKHVALVEVLVDAFMKELADETLTKISALLLMAGSFA